MGVGVNDTILSETLKVVGLVETVSKVVSVPKKPHELVCIRQRPL